MLKLKRFRLKTEPDDIYVVLVGELFSSWIPAAIMGMIFVGLGLFVCLSLGSPFVLAVTSIGGLLIVARVGMIVVFRRRLSQRRGRREVARWETSYTVASVGFAAMVALMAVATFAAPDLSLQMVATAQLFGFCSGIVARSSVRPRFAIMTVTMASLPVIAAAAAHGGSAHWMLAATIMMFLGGSIESIRYIHSSAGRQIAMRLDMAMLAHSDPLTGLANRLGLRDAFRDMVAGDRHLPICAVHTLDLDRFKPVNDRYGHPVGDAVLRLLADRIRAVLRDGDIAARIGGDEFVVVQAAIQHADEAEMFAQRLARAITIPFELASFRILIGISLGYATCPPGALELNGLLATADAALYRVKRNGGGVARGDRDAAAA